MILVLLLNHYAELLNAREAFNQREADLKRLEPVFSLLEADFSRHVEVSSCPSLCDEFFALHVPVQARNRTIVHLLRQSFPNCQLCKSYYGQRRGAFPTSARTLVFATRATLVQHSEDWWELLHARIAGNSAKSVRWIPQARRLLSLLLGCGFNSI